MDKKLVLKIVPNDWQNESRDQRELSVVRELGADILVLAKGDVEKDDEVAGFKVKRMTSRPLGDKCPKLINRGVSMIRWVKTARALEPDAISGHDLIPLFIGWASTCFKKNKPKLVYDSHEFTVYSEGKSKFSSFLNKYMERFLIKRCAFAIEVGDTIAEEVQKIHNLKTKPVVVRNIPNRWDIDEEKCAEKRKEILSGFERQATDDTILLYYHGVVVPNRGVEKAIETLTHNENYFLGVMGSGSDAYKDELREMANELNVADRLQFVPAVKSTDLWLCLGAADIELILIQASCRSYYYSLPNKLFESIQAVLPVICSDFPAMRDIVDEYGVGVCCDEKNSESVHNAIKKICEKYENYRVNEGIAKEELCWEKEKKVLAEAYAGILFDK